MEQGVRTVSHAKCCREAAVDSLCVWRAVDSCRGCQEMPTLYKGCHGLSNAAYRRGCLENDWGNGVIMEYMVWYDAREDGEVQRDR